jgi:diguanylate cyclase (GGDEF)-like protein
LSQFAYEVRLFERFADLSDSIAKETPDLLILNIEFISEHIDSTAEIKYSLAFKTLHCPIIFTASEENFDARIRAVRAGAFGFLIKPLEAPKLITQIERALGQENQTGYRVLIVDDDTALAEHYRLALASAGMEVSTLSEPGKIIERMNEFHPELILMDIYMPEYTGTELAAIIRQYEEWVGLPIVYLSAETDVDEQIRVMGVGADDFLTKPISGTRLIAAVKVRASRARQLSELMTRDSLTGLLKHASIKEALTIEHMRAQRNRTPLAVIMADIDHFKKVNDTYGHVTGDNVIRAISYLLRQRLRKSDIIGRYGGEEFVAVLPECDSETARQLIDDIRERFSALRFHHQNDEFACTLSAGVMCTQLAPQATSGELLVMADEALYRSKHTGRNRVSVYESSTKT